MPRFKTLSAHRLTIIIMTMGISACWSTSLIAMDNMDHSQHHSADEHAAHRQMMNQEAYTRNETTYQLPDVLLTDQNGRKLAVGDVLGGNEPVILNFIFTTCTTICPVLSASFSQLQKKYASDLTGVRMISISIDPEHDTPAKMKEYAQKFGASESWTFLTGDLNDVHNVLKAFDAYRGDKMNHIPLTFLRASAEDNWVRLEGFASAGDLIREYRALTSKVAPGSS